MHDSRNVRFELSRPVTANCVLVVGSGNLKRNVQVWRFKFLRVAVRIEPRAGWFANEDRGGPMLRLADKINRRTEGFATDDDEQISRTVKALALNDLAYDIGNQIAITTAVVAH